MYNTNLHDSFEDWYVKGLIFDIYSLVALFLYFVPEGCVINVHFALDEPAMVDIAEE